ncbi:TPM domain-containing protein [Acinetobacter zhairhuonensis]|uniref:TPM domain-containing protein n=1 Tax=Acinetobacter sp. A7.4 TaxID=2919921 RepID=UPI001F4F6D1D|nr:TPM domain-containing protein [Acinetobacter sp. A7.4]MCJ8161419.1 TPM domain-containing protein [Acinetobacter sp. A7.4]
MVCLKDRMQRVVLWLLIGFLSLILCSLSWAETNQTESHSEDAVVIGKILQQAKNGAATSEIQQQASSKVQVANDLADGQMRSLPSLNAPVIDQANILSAQDKQSLSDQTLRLHQQGKAQIGVIIVPTTGQEAIFDYAMRVAEQWQLGSAKRDNGLLMVIAINDRKMQILTGYGLEGVLPDIVAGQIIRNQITPYFKQAEYAQGIGAGLNEIERILNLDPEIAQQAAQQLKEQQAQALHEQQAHSQLWTYALIIVVVGAFASMMIGNRLSAATAGVAGVVAGWVSGVGVFTSLLVGLGIFLLLITSLAQLILQLLAAGAGRSGRGSGGGGFGGGGGYRGGGGGFGGGGASGSW